LIPTKRADTIPSITVKKKHQGSHFVDLMKNYHYYELAKYWEK